MDFQIYFSDFFKVPKQKLDSYGALDISLINDLPLFIDPFLLFNSENPEYQALHQEIIRYVKFLRDKSAKGPLSDGLISAWFTFPEIRQNWLGYSREGNKGHGLGLVFAEALNRNLNTVFKSFGTESITSGSHIEKLCLIRDGVGKDNISDFTTNLIKTFLLEYTERFATNHIAPALRKQIHVSKASFNYTTETWQSRVFDLPYCFRDYVILTPKDILTKDDIWISRADLYRRYDEIVSSVPNAQLRAQLNNYFKSVLPKRPKKEDRDAAITRVLEKYPELLEYYIAEKEETGDEAQAVSSKRVRESEELLIDHVRDLVGILSQTTFYAIPGNSYTEALAKARYLKKVIEENDGYKVFYVDGKPVQREKDLHILYRLTWHATDYDVNSEVNNGRGPVDFSISAAAQDKTNVEFKLATNSHLERNLQKQVQIYESAGNAQRSIKVIMYFTAQERERVLGILKRLKLDHDDSIVLIDARRDNKQSASKA